MAEREGVARVAAGVARSKEDIALSRDPRLVPVVSKQTLDRVRASVARADVEIYKALQYAAQPHSQAEHIGALMGEMDWRSEKTRLLDELARELKPAAAKVDIGGFGY